LIRTGKARIRSDDKINSFDQAGSRKAMLNIYWRCKNTFLILLQWNIYRLYQH
jgi:hypothetical protein